MTDNNETAARERSVSEWQRVWGGYGIAAIVLAWFAAPAMKYMDARILFAVGAMLALTVSMWFDAWVGDRTKTRRNIAQGGVALIAAILFAWPQLRQAVYSIDANDRRCLAVQKDMLSARPLRNDDADIFQALGCRPQGQGSVYAVPRAKPGEAPDARKVQTVCEAIQHDMLAAKPRRDDSVDLFQALGCRPQGPGSVYSPQQSGHPRRS